jgi:hypothetical protein
LSLQLSGFFGEEYLDEGIFYYVCSSPEENVSMGFSFRVFRVRKNMVY